MNEKRTNEELMHYGVKGMRWGHRKALPESDVARNVRTAKQRYRDANRTYSKSFDKAYNKSIAAYSPLKKHRQANDARWDDAFKKGQKAEAAKAAYKEAKRTRKNAIKSTHNKLERAASLGERLTYNSATRKKAAKYIVDNNMSVAEATKKAKKEALRNTAIAIVGAAGAITLSSLMSKR